MGMSLSREKQRVNQSQKPNLSELLETALQTPQTKLQEDNRTYRAKNRDKINQKRKERRRLKKTKQAQSQPMKTTRPRRVMSVVYMSI